MYYIQPICMHVCVYQGYSSQKDRFFVRLNKLEETCNSEKKKKKKETT